MWVDCLNTISPKWNQRFLIKRPRSHQLKDWFMTRWMFTFFYFDFQLDESTWSMWSFGPLVGTPVIQMGFSMHLVLFWVDYSKNENLYIVGVSHERLAFVMGPNSPSSYQQMPTYIMSCSKRWDCTSKNTYTKAYEQCLEWDGYPRLLPCPILLIFNFILTNNMG